MYTALFRRFPPCLASTGDFFNSLLAASAFSDLLATEVSPHDQTQEVSTYANEWFVPIP
jgi:hypothetical protein